jgi:hypothetical protein
VDAIEPSASRLSLTWDDVVRKYERAATAHEAAQRALQTAEKMYVAASDEVLQAAETADRAAREWRMAQALIVVAAAADAARLDQARAGRDLKLDALTCVDGMSTHAYRSLLGELGTNLLGKDICHIVPLSLGGANHPANYVPCSASFNRSLGNSWNRDVCRWFGEARCRRAIAVSRKCGAYRGFGIR